MTSLGTRKYVLLSFYSFSQREKARLREKWSNGRSV
jgi:hypothetical protein